MTLWIGVAVTVLAAGYWLARPFLRPVRVEMNEAPNAISIFSDQLDELRRDRDAGLLTDADSDAAAEEIERRALRAAKSMDTSVSVVKRSPIAALALVAVAATASVGIYYSLGRPEAPDRPLAERRLESLQQTAAAGDLNSRISALVDVTKENPESFESWWMLARSYSAVGDHASAADAYRRAAELSGEKPAVLSAYAESMTLANGNKVPTAARLIFEQILRKTGDDPRARYYVALAKAQAQDFEGALADWLVLLRESDPQAPWTRLVRRDIVNMARFLKRDLRAVLPDATPAEIAKAGGSPAAAGAGAGDSAGQIAALKAELDAEPKNYKGWIALAELQAGAGENEAALEAIEAGRKHFAAAPFVLSKFDEAARGLGLDHLAAKPKPRGPSDTDVVAAAEMSESDRADMIAGMVAGLAARLEENPNDLDGWAMLIRSYSVMGKRQDAEKAVATALATFEGDAQAVQELEKIASSLGLQPNAAN